MIDFGDVPFDRGALVRDWGPGGVALVACGFLLRWIKTTLNEWEATRSKREDKKDAAASAAMEKLTAAYERSISTITREHKEAFLDLKMSQEKRDAAFMAAHDAKTVVLQEVGVKVMTMQLTVGRAVEEITELKEFVQKIEGRLEDYDRRLPPAHAPEKQSSG